MIIKYEVERTFKDKYSKEIIVKDTVLDVTIERMKELNMKKFGRVVDIILDSDEQENLIPEADNGKTEKVEENTEKYTKEQLENKTVNQLKDLAEEIKCELTKAKKEEIIEELLKFQEK